MSPETTLLKSHIQIVPTNILYIPNIRLRSDRFYTIYAIGLVGDQPTPQA